MEEFKLKLENITKTFPGVVALSNITFAIKEGEVRGLVGENGAGKSTLIKILTGAYKPDGGCIYINGIKFAELNPALSEQLGIAAVYQDLMLINHLTVQDNIFLGTELSKYSIIHKKKMYQKTREILSKMGYENIINPSDKVSNLRTALKGIVAIGKVLSKNVNTVILDEPTAVLSEREVKELFKIIKEMKSANLSVIYISHRLEEIFEICDSVTILKDGKLVATKMIPDVNEDSLIEMMVGRILNKSFYVARPAGQEILRVDRIETEKLKKCSFALKEGEIVGLYGLVGSGRTELARAIFGADNIKSGAVYIKNKRIKLKSPKNAIHYGIGYVPEDRKEEGLIIKRSVKDNINLPIYSKISKISLIDTKLETANALKMKESLAIKTPSISQIVEKLSGGTQQKVVLSKWLLSKSDIFILDEPTNGVDIGAKEEIYKLMNELANRGNALLFISSYIPELISICDRIIVMREGEITGEIQKENFSENKILALAIKSYKYDKNKLSV